MRVPVCVCALLLLPFLCCPAGRACAAGAGQGGDADEAAARLLDEAAAHGARIRSLSADFMQEKRMDMLTRPLASQGYFCLRRGAGTGESAAASDSLLWAYTKPLASGFIYRNGQGSLWEGSPENRRPAGAEERTLITAILRHMLDWVRINPAALHAHYRMTRPAPDAPELHLSPLRQTFFTRLEVLFTPDGSSVRRLIFVEPNGDTVRIAFSDTRVNQPLPGRCADYLRDADGR